MSVDLFSTDEQNYLMYKDTRSSVTLITAHRGLRQGAILENTLSAFKSAYEMGIDSIELDTHLTKDQMWLVHHDSTYLKRSNIIHQMNSQEIIKLAEDRDQEVTFLDEVVDSFRGKNVNIECKPNSETVGGKLVKFLEMNDFIESCNVSSSKIKTLLGARKISSDIRLSLIGVLLNYRKWVLLNKKINLFSINPLYIFTRKKKIERAHRMKVEIHTWTVNRPKDILRLLNDRVDVIITDRPILASSIRQNLQ